MFRTLVFRAGAVAPGIPEALFNSSPAEILALMELNWKYRDPARKTGAMRQEWDDALPTPYFNEAALLAKFQLAVPPPLPRPPVLPPVPVNPLWVFPHAIEAFCLENTRMVEIFRRVVGHFVHGEQLAVPPDAATKSPTDINAWLRTTETLFFSAPPALSSFNVISPLRPNGDSVRRNLYYRMFGADLLHPLAEPGLVEQLKPAASNRDFFLTFERLLAETWRGIVNASNTSGRRDTDDAAIATLATRLHDTMRDRRLGGNLQREEFYAVCMMSWFHMAIAWNSPIVKAMKAEADHPADRLARIGERVGLKAHVHSAAYIQMAPLATTIMEAVERGLLNDPANAPFLYKPMSSLTIPSLSETMTQLITLYMRATGRDIKAAAVTVSQRA